MYSLRPFHAFLVILRRDTSYPHPHTLPILDNPPSIYSTCIYSVTSILLTHFMIRTSTYNSPWKFNLFGFTISVCVRPPTPFREQDQLVRCSVRRRTAFGSPAIVSCPLLTHYRGGNLHDRRSTVCFDRRRILLQSEHDKFMERTVTTLTSV